MREHPKVSVVIPTKDRPELVRRAVMSVLTQTVEDIEVIVVIDGPDERTTKVLSDLHEQRLRCFELSESVGATEARNEGIRHARANWIALLDDDDEWLPEKLMRQLRAIAQSSHRLPVIATRLIASSSRGGFVWPRRPPRKGEPVGDYLFIRRSLFMAEGALQTSTLLAPRILFEETPFDVGLRRHQDWDWLLHACAKSGVGLELVMEPLVIWHNDIGLTRISGMGSWRQSLDWIQSVSHLVTPQAYAGFLVNVVSPHASAEGAWHAFRPLLWELVACGGARPWDYLFFLAVWLIPAPVRLRVRSLFLSR
jgi:glycosyltransferase involved in cell wall biosynthesis